MDNPETSQSSLSSATPSDKNTLVPTTDLIAEDCPRFRILIVGQSGVGKSSLINAIFKASLADVQAYTAGTANINEGITSPHNNHLTIHDSEGYEPGNNDKFCVLEKFITERCQKEIVAERIHAIWLCIMAPYTGGSIFQPWDEKMFQFIQHKVPMIIVYTKFDLVVAGLCRPKSGQPKVDFNQEAAEKYFHEKYGQSFQTSTRNVGGPGQIPYTVVSIKKPDTLQRLVDITMRSLHVDALNPSNGLTHRRDDSDAPQIAFAMAQRVDMLGKIDASVRVGKKKYWRAIASGIYLFNVSLKKCLYAIHKDIVTVWNIRDLDEILIGDIFCRRMMVIVEDLSDQRQKYTRAKQSKINVTATVVGRTKFWVNGVYRQRPEHIRCLMGYIIDLILILQAVFRVSIQQPLERKVTQDHVNEIIYEFHLSERKKSIHDAIRTFVGSRHPFSKVNVVDKIESLIKENVVTDHVIQLDQKKPCLSSLLRILRFEQRANSLGVNRVILDLVCKLLDSPDYGAIVSELEDPSDIDLFLDFFLYLLRGGSFSESGIPNVNRNARSLMYKLMYKREVLPKFLLLNDVKINAELGAVPMGGYGRVHRGEHKGQQVALKVVERGGNNDLRKKIFYRETLAWRSLSHSFILPLQGIFEDTSQAYFVTPFMTNGTLIQWRQSKPPDVPNIHRLILEVAEGMRYIHSEGLVHGDLRGENVLLNSNLHCQIADIALNSNGIKTLSASTFLFNYAAPELFMSQSENDGPFEDLDEQNGNKTMYSDAYAFGCLYYAIFFNTVPFEGKTEFEIMQSVTIGRRPNRLESPIMEDETWHLIQKCWEAEAFRRPTMKEITGAVTR